MNYYERHIGDYLKDTAHLSLLEHGIYSRLMDAYYSREAPIPADQAHRLVGAKTREEKAAVDAVLGEFFKLADGVWRQKRCDEVIEEHAAFIESQKAKAAKRWHPSGNAAGMPEHMPRHDSGIDPAIPPTSHLPLPKEEPPSPQPKTRRTKSALVPLPDAFELTPDLARYAAAKLPDANVTEMFEGFKGKAVAKGWKYADWDRAWQEFVRNCRKDSGHFAAGMYPKINGSKGEWM